MNPMGLALGLALGDRYEVDDDEKRRSAFIAAMMANPVFGMVGATTLLERAEGDAAEARRDAAAQAAVAAAEAAKAAELAKAKEQAEAKAKADQEKREAATQAAAAAAAQDVVAEMRLNLEKQQAALSEAVRDLQTQLKGQPTAAVVEEGLKKLRDELKALSERVAKIATVKPQDRTSA